MVPYSAVCGRCLLWATRVEADGMGGFFVGCCAKSPVLLLSWVVLCELLYVWPHVLLLSTALLHCTSSQKFNLGKKRIEMSLIRNWINIDKFHLPLNLLFPFLPLWTNWTQIANLLLIFMGYNSACKFFLLQIYRRFRPVTCSVHPHDSPPWGRRLQRARNSSQVW